MRSMSWWMAATVGGLALLVPRTACADELKITAFDETGLLTFQEVPAAESYRIEWATNLLSPLWSSNAPGIPSLPALQVGTLTATVGVVHPSCFYRVVASLTNLPATSITNSFDLTNEGWALVDFPFRAHAPNPATLALPFDASFGNPPGSVRAGDVYRETGVAAPAPYLGNKVGFYGGSLAFDIYLRFSDNATYPAVILNGGPTSLYYDTPSPPVNAWHHAVLPLSEDGWRVSGTGAPATEAGFRAVLSNLVGLYIYTEWHTGGDDTSVDNVTMIPAP